MGHTKGFFVDADPVTGVLVALSRSSAVGGGGSRMQNHHWRPPLGVELLGVADKGLVQMTRQDQIDAMLGKDVHGFPSVGGHRLAVEPGRLDDMVVGHDHLEDPWPR